MDTTTLVAGHLAYDWSRDEDGRLRLTVTEHRPRKPRTTRYRVVEQPRTKTGRVFLVTKDESNDKLRADEVYAVFVSVGRWSCTCPGSSYRNHEIKCRHVLAVREGFGVVFV